MGISIEHVHKKFGLFSALTDINLTIDSGELVALLGPSGSGKTTLLRMIAGLETTDSGIINFDGVDFTQKTAKERQIGFVFQHYALFRHMTVFENIAFGLRVKPKKERPNETIIKAKVKELLELIQLDWVADRYPSQLSGGQRQRIALARALAIGPKLLLLDEPFGALDAKVRQNLRKWLRDFHKTLSVTTILVTHDQDEALEVASKVVVMNEGKIEQVGTPEEVYNQPETPFVLNFLGNINLFRCRVENGAAILGNLSLSLQNKVDFNSESATLYVRPDQFEVTMLPINDNSIQTSIHHIHRVGALTKLELVTEWKDTIQVELPQDKALILNLSLSDTIYITPKKLGVFEENTSGFYMI